MLSFALFHLRAMCGLPFKKLDKKAEKQFLFNRRQHLIQLLQSTIDPEAVLELTIMILFQQIRQVVVFGSLIRGPILSILLEERKISDPVRTVLRTMAAKLQDEGPGSVEEELLSKVKEFGLCRDIAKFQLE